MKTASENLFVCPVCHSGNGREDFNCTDYFVTGERFPVMKCDTCGFRWTAKVPPLQEISRYYQSEAYISHSDTQKGLTNRLYHLTRDIMLGQKSRIITRTTGISSGAILDVGTGTGYFLQHMQKRGWKVTGTEPNESAREFALSEWKLPLLPAEALFDLPGRSFDIITLWHVLEHLDNPEKYLQKFTQLLKPGGFLCIAVPNPASSDALHYGKFWAAWDVPRHLWHFTPANMEQFIENNGYQPNRIFRMPFDAFYVSILSEQYKKNKGTGLSKKDRFLILLKGFFWGQISWIICLFRPLKCSSLIYLLSLKS